MVKLSYQIGGVEMSALLKTVGWVTIVIGVISGIIVYPWDFGVTLTFVCIMGGAIGSVPFFALAHIVDRLDGIERRVDRSTQPPVNYTFSK